ncbi:MAG: NAD(P)H-dependent oxidoreductase [Woeseiaceae bacterium]|nr:NAD(P)H-dependent oxidoreductase [Woeseiaceae bacterium]
MTGQADRDDTLRILAVHGSGRRTGSVSRKLTGELIEALESREGTIDVVHRDLADGVPLVDEAWIDANFTPDSERSRAQRAELADSDALVDELEAADVVIIGSPIYNFGIPAALKAWIDLVARARRTFRYTDSGPEGLLKNKQAYVVMASGGVAVDSEADFATPYLRHALGFVGIDDVEVVAAERLNIDGDDAVDTARMRIADLVFTAGDPEFRAA